MVFRDSAPVPLRLRSDAADTSLALATFNLLLLLSLQKGSRLRSISNGRSDFSPVDYLASESVTHRESTPSMPSIPKKRGSVRNVTIEGDESGRT